MLFNSIEYLLFLPIVFLSYWVLGKRLYLQNALLLLASYFFYGWWSLSFLGLLILSTTLDFFYGFGVHSENRKKAKLFLWLSIVNNLGILAVFKYYNFFAIQFQLAASSIGLDIPIHLLNVILPVGISFYTFHGMSYVFDIYYQRQKPIRSILDYALFVGFFPLLVAGPIERAHHLLPQVQKPRELNYHQLIQGCRLMLWGFFKKVFIADNLAEVVDKIYANADQYNSYTLLLGMLAFSFQIYCDFSGYTDIALGTAKLFGFELLSNFKFPYFSRDLAEFWRRWHISLSSWFRDYLYIPLGGSKNGKLQTIRNIFIIFIVSGFWHGASWNFIVWGGLHACGFLPILLLNKNRIYVHETVAYNRNYPNLKEILQISSTFIFVSFAWIFFRASTLNEAIHYVYSTLTNFDIPIGDIISEIKEFNEVIIIIPFVIIDWMLRNNERILLTPRNMIIRWFVYIIMGVLVFINMSDKVNFIYFQF